MRPESGILGFVALFLALAGLGPGRPAQAADDELTKQLSHQMATLIGAPDEGAAIAVDAHSMEPVDLDSSWAFDANDVAPGQLAPSTNIGTDSADGSGAWTFQYTTATRDLSGAEAPSTGRPAAAPRTARAFDPLTDHFWPLAKDGRNTNVSVTFSEQLRSDEASDDILLSPGTGAADGGGPDALPGPTNFQISKSFKIKAQPVGGGLGGRVTFTFLLPTGAER